MISKFKEWHMRANHSEILWEVSILGLIIVGLIISSYPALNIVLGIWGIFNIVWIIRSIFFTKK